MGTQTIIIKLSVILALIPLYLKLKASASHFHAHISIDIELYVRLINEKQLNSRNFKVTKNWDKDLPSSSIKELYLKNVFNYKKKFSMELENYKRLEIDAIQGFDEEKLCLNGQAMTEFCGNNKVNVSFDVNAPLIRFALKERVTSQKAELKGVLLRSMVDYALQSGHFEKTSGSHICLKMDGEFSVEAYVRIGGDRFYLVHPQRKRFLENFAKPGLIYFET